MPGLRPVNANSAGSPVAAVAFVTAKTTGSEPASARDSVAETDADAAPSPRSKRRQVATPPSTVGSIPSTANCGDAAVGCVRIRTITTPLPPRAPG